MRFHIGKIPPLLTLVLALVLLVWSTASGQSSRPVQIQRALLVGVEEYPDSRRNLPGVKTDVKSMTESLLTNGLTTQAGIKTLLDGEATKSNIVKAIKEWLVQGSRPGDTVLFYFSGHGIQVWDENGDEADGRDEALMCYDSDVLKNKVARTFKGQAAEAFLLADTVKILLDDEINELLAQLQGRTAIFVSDSCHSGSVYKRLDPLMVRNKTLDAPLAMKSVFDPRISEHPRTKAPGTNIGEDLRVRGVSVVAMTASEDEQPAQIAQIPGEPARTQSVFTWSLCQGLKGAADLNEDGVITFDEIAAYVKKQINQAGFAQVPQSEWFPATLANSAFVTRKSGAQPRLTKPSGLRCFIRPGKGITPQDVGELKATLVRTIPGMVWSEDGRDAACVVNLERSGESWGARLSDYSGAYWEPHAGSTLAEVGRSLVRNLVATGIYSFASVLRNPATSSGLDVKLLVKGRGERTPGEVVKGDDIGFEIKAARSGHLYVFNVDPTGIIHPLYPPAGASSPMIHAGESVRIGDDGSFSVQEPLGRELVFAVLLGGPSPELDRLWALNDVGDTSGRAMTEQERFLDALWNVLVKADGSPKGEWASAMSIVTSFGK